MSDSAFDPLAFLSGTYTEGIDTRVPLHKPGDWTGYVGAGEKDIIARPVTRQDGTTALAMDVYCYTPDPSAKGEGTSPNLEARARYSVWADLTPAGSIDFAPGKSRSLGMLLTALGFQDKTGKLLKPWSPQMFKGMPLKYRVIHEVRKDTGDPVANVNAVLPIS